MRGIRGFFKRALVLVAVLSAVTGAFAAATAAASGDSTNGPDGKLSVITVPTTTVADASQTSTTGTGTGTATLQQRINVRINGGTLTITPSTINVTLARVGHAYKGSLPAVQIIDARGSLAGWTATVAPATLPAGTQLHVRPGKPAAVTGLQGEVSATHPGIATANSPVALASAAPNGGGGTFSVDAALELIAPSTTAQTLTLSLDLVVS